MRRLSHSRQAKSAAVSVARSANAKEAIGELENGAERFILTLGQFSIMDAIIHLQNQIGPSDVTISTWTAAKETRFPTQRSQSSGSVKPNSGSGPKSSRPSRRPKAAGSIRPTYRRAAASR